MDLGNCPPKHRSDCVIILTDHININYNLIKENANFIVDTRNIYKNKSNEILKL